MAKTISTSLPIMFFKTSSSVNAGSSTPDYSSSVEFDEFDFDELEKQLDASMQSSMSYTGINM